jgi:hypothetical protein
MALPPNAEFAQIVAIDIQSLRLILWQLYSYNLYMNYKVETDL